MKNYVKQIVITIFLISTIICVKAQSTTTTPSVTRFSDIIEVGFTGIALQANTPNNGVSVGLTNIFAYNITNQFSAGIGIGYENNNDNYFTGSSSYLPLSANFRFYFSQSTLEPFLNLSSGYSFNLNNAGLGGDEFFTGLNIGLKITTKSNIGIEFATGLKYEDYSYRYPEEFPTPFVTNFSRSYLYIPFTIGLVF